MYSTNNIWYMTDEDVVKSRFGNETITNFVAEGGVWSSDTTGRYLLYPYCAGISLPLTNSTFFDAVKLSYLWESTSKAYKNTSYAQNTSLCAYHFMAIPMLNVVLENINLMKNSNGEYSKLVFHSIHDTTVELLLKALRLWDGELVIFGEMVTIEIYTKLDNMDEYYFRITRKGEFVPYPLCEYQNDSQLCDLNVLLDNSFNDVVNQTVWSNTMCANVLSNCQCGYCKEMATTTTSGSDSDECNDTLEDSFDTKSISFWAGIVIGVIFGGVVMVLLIVVWRRVCTKKEKIDNSYFLNDSKM